jgi:radical SAM protein (TIGR01212 family)
MTRSNNRFYDLNTYFRGLFGCRVHKITVDAGLSCPNRDGCISRQGCIFCNARGSGTGAHEKGLDIIAQVLKSKTAVAKRFKAKKFLVYFQSFSNTYAPTDHLKRLYDDALSIEDIVGLAIGTRPDCVNPAVLDLLQSYTDDYLIWLEYGLQSVHNDTLALINRGHDFNCFADAVAATKNRGIKICAHIVLGLPNESEKQMMETADTIAALGVDGIKLHLLYVVKGTRLEAMYRSGEYTCLEQQEYADLVCNFLERLPRDMLIHRLTGDPHPKELVAPLWAMKKAETIGLIKETLIQRDTRQGIKVVS